MAKLTLTNIATGHGSATAYNANNDLVEAALEKTLSLDGTTPNQMSAPLDMNSQNINNAGNVATTAVTIAGVSIVAGSTLTVPSAVNVPNVAAGNIIATDVQAALNELDTEKANLSGAAFSGATTFSAGPTTNSPIVHRATVANHIRAGNTQILTGASSQSAFSIVSNVTQFAFETVGPTGSGATNIWTDMNVIPTEATILICNLELAGQTTGTGAGQIAVYATDGDSVAVAGLSNQIGFYRMDQDAAITGISGNMLQVLIPLESVNQDFRINWSLSVMTSVIISLHYKGFMTD